MFPLLYPRLLARRVHCEPWWRLRVRRLASREINSSISISSFLHGLDGASNNILEHPHRTPRLRGQIGISPELPRDHLPVDHSHSHSNNLEIPIVDINNPARESQSPFDELCPRCIVPMLWLLTPRLRRHTDEKDAHLRMAAPLVRASREPLSVQVFKILGPP